MRIRQQLFAALVAVMSSAGATYAQGAPAPFSLTTPAYTDGGVIPVRFTQAEAGVAAGEGTSPALNWANPPQGTVSFLLHMHDMEVVRNKTTEDQLHWLVWNIPGASRGLPEGVAKGSPLPDGSNQVSATGAMYRGPGAPAAGLPHHYVMELYALDTMLTVTPGADVFATRAAVLAAAQGHILGKAVLLGFFKRPQ